MAAHLPFALKAGLGARSPTPSGGPPSAGMAEDEEIAYDMATEILRQKAP